MWPYHPAEMGGFWGIGFLISVILLLRIMTYVTGILNCAIELFTHHLQLFRHPKLAGDWFINAFLFCGSSSLSSGRSAVTIPQSCIAGRTEILTFVGLSLL